MEMRVIAARMGASYSEAAIESCYYCNTCGSNNTVKYQYPRAHGHGIGIGELWLWPIPTSPQDNKEYIVE
jgi:hypothetical protein